MKKYLLLLLEIIFLNTYLAVVSELKYNFLNYYIGKNYGQTALYVVNSGFVLIFVLLCILIGFSNKKLKLSGLPLGILTALITFINNISYIDYGTAITGGGDVATGISLFERFFQASYFEYIPWLPIDSSLLGSVLILVFIMIGNRSTARH